MSPQPTGPGVLAGTGDRFLMSTPDHCLGFAANLAMDFEHAHVAALTDASGVVVDGTVLTDPAHCIDHAVGFALCLALTLVEQAHGSQLTLFSVMPCVGGELSPEYSAAYERTVAVFDGLVEVRDWIVTDGLVAHSLACAAAPDGSWARACPRPGPAGGAGSEVVLP